MAEVRARRAPLPGPLGLAAATVYSAIVARRNRRFDAGIGVERLPVPVISVGNLSVGGTGKTPMVMHVLTGLAGLGWSPCVAMRGYRSKDGESDEAAEYSRQFPNVPVVAQPDRLNGIRRLMTSEAGRCINAVVLDDGFQHRRIWRDLDVVLLDATRSPFEDGLLPAGWLREPVESLRRAHVVVVSHAESVEPEVVEEILRRARIIHPGLVTAVSSHRWGFVRSTHPHERTGAPGDLGWAPDEMRGRRVLIACAIGNPGPLIREAERHIGGPAAGVFLRRDHDPYSPGTVRELAAAARECRAELILTTEKDWSKLRRVPIDDWPCPVLRPRLILKIETGGKDLAVAFTSVLERYQRDGSERSD